MALISRLDGTPPVESISAEVLPDGGRVRMAPEMRMTRLEGRWQFF